MTSNTNNSNNSFSFAAMATAIVRFTPRLPRFLLTLLQLAWAHKGRRGSTGYFLQCAAQRYPERIALKFAGQSYSYAQLNQWANGLAEQLQRRAVGRGDCVALLYRNSPEVLAWAFAINKLGAIAGMLNPKQQGEALSHSVQVMQPQLLIHAPEFAEAAQQLESHTPCLHATAELMQEAQQSKAANPPQAAQVKLGDTCFYMMTSGTTGLPKAAAMTHLRWYKAGIAFGRMSLSLKKNDTLYNCLPLYHNTALSIALSSTVMTGTTLALAERFSASQFWQDIQRFNATGFVYVGELCRYLLNQPASPAEANNSVRAVIGNGLRAEIWDQFQQRFGISRICELYGASEGNVGFVNVFNLKRTVGFSPMTYAIVKFDHEHETPLRDANGRLSRVTKGDVGLLLTKVSAKAPFDGYTHNPKANAEKLFENVFQPGDCWFNTGDLVRHQGYRHIAFVDRVGDTFRWKSENVATTEVEAQAGRFRDVLAAVAYGVKVPHTEGRAGMVSLVLAHGKHFDARAFYQHIRAVLPDYAQPLFIRLQRAHEVTSTLKIRKSQLKLESFSPEQISDPLYVLLDRSQGYQPLDPQLYQRISSGQLRF
ncbi:long-chain-acyl-CoA synthetase [Pseudidiomarina insulisalsae]|uniref:Long-chain-acyl-CoA synthetase n=1 Tax=Pseudidiomarina insulisalsae TaxID=575789 RepID=A0A432YMN1_9GAMM|nr:long-chain-acyl-CoA synthetase [Pseudidiomarina insulisalsae]RUO62192.1 long-chain-acyl-CoA synthetase [Pseudidiomarina insulisalsae]